MFDRIAPVYDAMNRLMTPLDRWAAAAARSGRALRRCRRGTGDLALPTPRRASEVVGIDSPAMPERARRKSTEVEWIQADLLALPLPDAISTRPPSAWRTQSG
jgi:ubiquinone/menaquinone biosynthesis C-methylase UbiE